MTRLHRIIGCAAAAATLAVATACSGSGPAGSGAHTSLPNGVTQVGPVALHHEASESGGLHYSVTWAEIKDAGKLNTLVAKYATDQLTAFRADFTPSKTAPPELNIRTDATRVGNVVAVHLSTYLFAGASGQTSNARFYGAADGSWAVTSAGLVAAGHQAALSTQVATHVAPGLAGSDLPAPTDVLTDLAVGANQALTVTLDQGVLAPYSDGNPAVTIPAAQARRYLSGRGTSVAAAYRAHRPVTLSPPAGPPPAAPLATAPPSSSTTSTPVDCAVATCIALTFDDGPGPYTARLLDELVSARAPATFFMLGRSARQYPQLVARAAAFGMVVANHTWDHRDLAHLTPAQQQREVTSTSALLEQLTGQPVTLLRPPYGSYDHTTRGLGLPLVLWDVDTQDWANRNTQTTTRRALKGARPGAIILMHDIRPTSVTAVPGIIAALRKQGYTLVTVPQLLGTTAAGQVYTGRAP